MDTGVGGWTVITKRIDGKVAFDRTWNEYRKGFGNVGKEYWIGNDYLRYLTLKKQKWVLRIDAWYANGHHIFGEWENFAIGSEDERYKITFGKYRGNLPYGDRLRWQYGMKFSTKDQDNDNWTSHCSKTYGGGGFWFNACSHTYITNRYNYATKLFSGMYHTGKIWLKRAEMKLRPNSI